MPPYLRMGRLDLERLTQWKVTNIKVMKRAFQFPRLNREIMKV